MKLKSIFDDALDRGEKLKTGLVNELFNSKTVQDLVSNSHFVSAVSRIIETKDEITRVIGKQVKTVFEMMDVPTRAELKRIGLDIGRIEKIIDKVGRNRIAVKVLTKSPKSKKASAPKKRSKKSGTKKKSPRK